MIDPKTRLVATQTDKYDSLAQRLHELPLHYEVSIWEWKKIIGKLCWFVTLTRPTLEAFALVYKYPRPSSQLDSAKTFLITTDQHQELKGITSLNTSCAASPYRNRSRLSLLFMFLAHMSRGSLKRSNSTQHGICRTCRIVKKESISTENKHNRSTSAH